MENKPEIIRPELEEGEKLTPLTPYSGLTTLGKEIKISPKAYANVYQPGHSMGFPGESIQVNINIGKSNRAALIMSIEAWEALNNNEEIYINTLKEIKQKLFIKHKTK